MRLTHRRHCRQSRRRANLHQLLRGEDGSRDVIVDSHGGGGLSQNSARQARQDLKLTIDIDLQRTAEWLWRRTRCVAWTAQRRDSGSGLPSSYDQRLRVRINHADWDKLSPPTTPDEQSHPGPARSGSTSRSSCRGRPAGGLARICASTAKAAPIFTALLPLRSSPWRAGIRTPFRSRGHLLLHAGSKLGIDTIASSNRIRLDRRPHRPAQRDAGIMPSTQWEMKNYHQRYYPATRFPWHRSG